MSRAIGNGALDTLSKAIGSDKINENAADIQGIMDVTYGDGSDAVHLVEKSGTDYASPALIEIHHQINDLQTPEKPTVLEYSDMAPGFYLVWGYYTPGIIMLYISTNQAPTYTANYPLITLNGYNSDIHTALSVDGVDYNVSNSGSNLVLSSKVDITTNIDICVFIPAYKI